MPAAGSPAAGQSASGRASKQEAGRAAGDQIKQDGGLCSLVLVRCVIFFVSFRRFGRSAACWDTPAPVPTPPTGHAGTGIWVPYPRQKIFIKIDNFVKSGIAVPGLF